MWLQMKGLEHFGKSTLRKKCPKAEFFLVCIFLYSVPIQKNTIIKNTEKLFNSFQAHVAFLFTLKT